MKSFYFYVFTTLFIITLLVISVPFAQETEAVRVAGFLPLTGEYATYAKAHESGWKIGVEVVNQRGGINGRKLDLTVFDTRGTQQGTIESIQKAERVSNVPIVLGGIISDLAMTAASYVQRQQKILLVQSATNPAITKVGPNIFRFVFPDDAQGKMMARFAYQKLNIRHVVVFKNTSRLYSSGLADFFSQAFKELGGSIVQVIRYDETTNDFTPLVSPLKKETRPFAVYIPGYDLDTARVIHAFKKLNMDPIFLGGDAWESENLTNLIPELSNGYYSTAYSVSIPSEENQFFVNQYKKIYGKEPSFNAAIGYGSILLLAECLKRTDLPWTVERLRQTLMTQTFQDFLGEPLRFDRDGNAIRPVVIMKFENGKHTFFDIIKP